jgi:hypothetical protein
VLCFAIYALRNIMSIPPLFKKTQTYAVVDGHRYDHLGVYIRENWTTIQRPRYYYERYKELMCNIPDVHDTRLVEILSLVVTLYDLKVFIMPLTTYYMNKNSGLPVIAQIKKKSEIAADQAAKDEVHRFTKEWQWNDKQDGRNKFNVAKLRNVPKHMGHMIAEVVHSLSTVESFSALPIENQLDCAFHCIMKGQEFHKAVLEHPWFAEYLYTETVQYDSYFHDLGQLIEYVVQQKINRTQFDCYVKLAEFGKTRTSHEN